MKKRVLSLLLAVLLLAALTPIMTQDASAHGSNGIYGNGTGGVYIDIYSHEFVTLSKTSWGEYAYGPQGCAWFASARQWQLTGNRSVIWRGESWWNNGNGQLGYPTGRIIKAPAIVCFSGHVAIVEAVRGDQALISEGGRTDFPNNDYCHLGWQSISRMESKSGFLGYVYLSGAPSFNASWEGPSATDITETNARLSGQVNFGQTVTFTQNGVRVVDAAGNTIASKDEWPGTTYSYLNIWYDVNGELGVALQSGKTYRFQFYVIVGGKEYWSPIVTFTTAHTHNYKTTVTAPTCTAKGYTTHTCSCGESYVDTYVDALGHAWDSGKVSKEPTETEDGVKTYTCTRCGETKTEVIPATGSDVDVTEMFSDVTRNWAYDGIQYCVTHKLMGSTGGDKFSPSMTTTRAQIVQILYNLEGEPKVSGTMPFTDVAGHWAQDAILWAYQTGVVSGTSDTTFAPDLPVTREQIAVILMGYADKILKLEHTWTPADLSTFPDAGSVSGWAKDALADAVALGLISGASNGGQTYLNPQGSATREQVATILMEFCKNVKK